MEIYIFEGLAIGDTDTYIINMKSKHPDAMIRKVDITNKDQMKDHEDVISILREKGLDALPIVKVDGKITEFQRNTNNKVK
jgi:50S ribosomal subunit-associated GTPase HflX